METREALAEYAHEAWSGWMNYMFSKCLNSSLVDGDLVIPKEFVQRWMRQASTGYNQLPEEEKPSDREQADKILTIIGKSNAIY